MDKCLYCICRREVASEHAMVREFDEFEKIRAQLVLFITSQDNRKNVDWYAFKIHNH